MKLTDHWWTSAVGDLMIVMVVVVIDFFSWFRGSSLVMLEVMSMFHRLRSSDAAMVMVVSMVREHHLISSS